MGVSLLLTVAIPLRAQTRRTSPISSESFQVIGGALAQISIGADGSVWGINSEQQIYTYNSATSKWTNIPGSLKLIATGSNNAVWGLNYVNQIYHWDAATNSWVNVPGELNQIAVGADGDVWGINYIGNIYFYNGSGWTQVTGTTLSSITVGSAGAVYGLDSNGSIYWYNPGSAAFQSLAGTTGFTQLSAGVDGDLWAVKNGVAYHYDVLHATMKATTGAAIDQVRVGYGAAVFGLDAAGDVFQWDAMSQAWAQISGNLSSVAVGANGTVWGINSSQQIYQLLGAPTREYQSSFQIPGANLDQISVGVDGAVWGVSNSMIEFFDRGMQTFQEVAGAPPMKQISAGARADVWGVDASGNIYQYDATTGTWNTVPGELNMLQVGADGSVWGINAAGSTYTYNSSTSSWTQIPGQLATLSAGAKYTEPVQADSVVMFVVSGTLAPSSSPGAFTGELSGYVTIDTTSGIVIATDLFAAGGPFTLTTQEVDLGHYYEIDAENSVHTYSLAITLPTGSLVGYNGGSICGATGTNCENVGSTLFNSSGTEVSYVTGNASFTALTSDEEEIWGINRDQQVYRFDSTTQSWVNIPGSLKQLSVGNAVWGINAQDQVYQYDSARHSWAIIPGAFLTQISASFDGAVWGVNASGSMYQWNAATKTFGLVSNGVSGVVIGNAANVWSINTSTGAVSVWF